MAVKKYSQQNKHPMKEMYRCYVSYLRIIVLLRITDPGCHSLPLTHLPVSKLSIKATGAKKKSLKIKNKKKTNDWTEKRFSGSDFLTYFYCTHFIFFG